MSRKPPCFQLHPATFVDARARGLVRACGYHVVDGDTADFLLDIGWYHYAYIPLRLSSVDAPETRGTTGEEREKALLAKDRFEELICDQPALVRSYRERRSFERFIADVWVTSRSTVPGHLNNTIRVGGRVWYKVQEILLAEALVVPIQRYVSEIVSGSSGSGSPNPVGELQ
jgi:endonuclease YncB( thermonuclease family)